jgi:hypothetical protein
MTKIVGTPAILAEEGGFFAGTGQPTQPEAKSQNSEYRHICGAIS